MGLIAATPLLEAEPLKALPKASQSIVLPQGAQPTAKPAFNFPSEVTASQIEFNGFVFPKEVTTDQLEFNGFKFPSEVTTSQLEFNGFVFPKEVVTGQLEFNGKVSLFNIPDIQSIRQPLGATISNKNNIKPLSGSSLPSSNEIIKPLANPQDLPIQVISPMDSSTAISSEKPISPNPALPKNILKPLLKPLNE